MRTFSYALFDNTQSAQNAAVALNSEDDLDVSLHVSEIDRGQIRWNETAITRGLLLGVILGSLSGLAAGFIVSPLGLGFFPFVALGALQGTLIGGLAGALAGTVNKHKELKPLIEAMEDGQALMSIESQGRENRNRVRNFLEAFKPQALVQSQHGVLAPSGTLTSAGI